MSEEPLSDSLPLIERVRAYFGYYISNLVFQTILFLWHNLRDLHKYLKTDSFVLMLQTNQPQCLRY